MPNGCSRSPSLSALRTNPRRTQTGHLRNAKTCEPRSTGRRRTSRPWVSELAVELQNLWNASARGKASSESSAFWIAQARFRWTLRASALRVRGGAADLAGNDQLAVEATEESVELYRQLGDDRGVALVEQMLAVSAWRRQDWGRMRSLTEHSLALSEGRFPFIELSNYWLLGQLALIDGDVERAIELTRHGTEMAHEAGWAWWESGQRHELLMLALLRGDLDEAEREGLIALEMERTQENRLWALYTLAGLAQLALVRGDFERAGLLWGAADAEGERLPRWPNERDRRAGALVEETREQFADARERGRALDIWDAAAIALGEDAG